LAVLEPRQGEREPQQTSSFIECPEHKPADLLAHEEDRRRDKIRIAFSPCFLLQANTFLKFAGRPKPPDMDGMGAVCHAAKVETTGPKIKRAGNSVNSSYILMQ
jgi:hypothetical protein